MSDLATNEVAVLIRRCAYDEALEVAAEKLGPSLGRTAMAMLGEQTEAEQAIVKALSAFRDAMPQLESTPLAPWLYGYVHRICRRRLQKQSSQERASALQLSHEDDRRLPTAAAAVRDNGRRVRQALETMEARRRDALVLRYVAALEYEALAQALSTTVEEASQLCGNGLADLTRGLGGEETTGEPEDQGFIPDLSLIADGDAAAMQRHSDALLRDNAARALRDGANDALFMLEQAGSDYRPGADLLEGVRNRSQAAAQSKEIQDPSSLPPPPMVTEAVRRSQAPPARASRGPAAASSRRPSAKPAPQGRKGLALLLLVALAGAVAAFALGLFEPAPEPTRQTSPQVQLVVPPRRSTLSARVDVVRGPKQGKGLSLSGQPAPPGTDLEAGAELLTDAATRAGLSLSDGSSLVLNHDTRLTLHKEEDRTLVLSSGEVLAEVAQTEGVSPLVVNTPHGRITVTGTKLAVTVTATGTGVRVTRGSVTLGPANGEAVAVQAGQEGLLPRSGAASVVPMMHMAGVLAWSELGQAQTEADGAPVVRGLGQLQAKRPDTADTELSALTLSQHEVQVRIAGNMARTEVTETFDNETEHELEGIYRFPLPPGARIAALSLEVDGHWEQGSFVERARAKKIWRGVIHNAKKKKKTKKPKEELIWVPGPWRDPALLEWQQGGRFQLRIFPIPAHGSRRVRIAYTERLTPQRSGRRYVHPLPQTGSGQSIERFAVDLRVAGQDGATLKSRGYALQPAAEGFAFQAERFVPHGDLIVDVVPKTPTPELSHWTYQGEAAAAPTGKLQADVLQERQRLRADGRPYVAMTLRPRLPALSEHRPMAHTLIVDSSQSMVGERFRRAAELVERAIAEMDRRDSVELLACDLRCSPMQEGPLPPSSQASAQARTWLSSIRPAGSTNLAATLDQVAARLTAAGSDTVHQRVVLISDGVASVGPRRVAALAARAEALVAGADRSLSTVALGADADTLVLSSLARAGRGHYLAYRPGQSAGAAALDLLEAGLGQHLTDATLELPEGLSAVAPSQLPSLRAGQELLVVARMDADQVTGEAVLRGQVGGEPYENRYALELIAQHAEGNRFVPRLWASETIDELERGGEPRSRSAIAALSLSYGVISRHTSLLVLESEAMFRAFGLEQAPQHAQWTGEESAEGGSSEGSEDFVEEVAPLGKQISMAPPSPRAAMAPRRRAKASTAGAEATDILADGDDRSSAGLGSRGAPSSSASGARIAKKRPRRPPPRRPSPGRFMKREWYRDGQIDRGGQVRKRDLHAVDEAARALEESPDSRDRHRVLARALSRVGNLERARGVVESWIERDALDPEALTYLSDVLGREGKRDEALRLLTGIVDLQPDNRLLQSRLARAFERANMLALACAHRQTLAELDAEDAESLAGAIRCLRQLERTAEADALRASITDDKLRTKVAALTEKPTTSDARGDLLLSADWKADVDLDLSLVTLQGTRISWMGGRVNVVGKDASSHGKETLGLKRGSAGRYSIEVARTDPKDTRQVSGTIRVKAMEEVKTLRFSVSGPRAEVGRVTVRRKSRLIPTSAPVRAR